MPDADSGNYPDRRVHCELGQLQIVRYERAGKWYIEAGGAAPRVPVTCAGAARYALAYKEKNPETVIHLGVPGGAAFDRKIRSAPGRDLMAELEQSLARARDRHAG